MQFGKTNVICNLMLYNKRKLYTFNNENSTKKESTTVNSENQENVEPS